LIPVDLAKPAIDKIYRRVGYNSRFCEQTYTRAKALSIRTAYTEKDLQCGEMVCICCRKGGYPADD